MYNFQVSGYRLKHLSRLIYHLYVFGLEFDILLLGLRYRIIDSTLLLAFGILILVVWILDESLPLLFYVLIFRAGISNQTLLPVSDISLLGVWISDETLPLVFDI